MAKTDLGRASASNLKRNGYTVPDMNHKMPTILALAVVAAVAATSAHALYAPGVSVVEVDMTRAVGIISTESGHTYAKVVGPGGSATYDITDPNNATPMFDPVTGVTSLDWSPLNGVALASVGERSYAVVAAPGSPDGSTVEVCRLVTVTDIGAPDAPSSDVSVVPAPAPVAGHVELPEAEPVPAVMLTDLNAYTTGDALVVTGTVKNPSGNATVVRLSSLSVGNMGSDTVLLDPSHATLTMLRGAEPATYALAVSALSGPRTSDLYGVLDGGEAVGEVAFTGHLHAGTVLEPEGSEVFRVTVEQTDAGFGLTSAVAHGSYLTLTISSWIGGEWIDSGETVRVTVR